MKFDPYKLLGISPQADMAEIRRAFREKARRYHPDMGGDKALFLALKRSYEELCNRRAQRSSLKVVKEPPRTGNYLLTFLDLSVRELAFGGVVSVIVPDKSVVCPRCQGRKVDPQGRQVICPLCKGKGVLENRQGEVISCPRCEGQGKMVVDPCPICRGRGRLEREREIEVRVPQGLKPNDILLLPASPEGPPVDIYFEIQVHSHHRDDFIFKEGKLATKVRLPFWKVILGGKVQVSTLEGREEIEIPPGFDPATTLILPKRGAFRADGTREDLLIYFEVYFPKNLSPKALELLEKLAQILEQEEKDDGSSQNGG